MERTSSIDHIIPIPEELYDGNPDLERSQKSSDNCMSKKRKKHAKHPGDGFDEVTVSKKKHRGPPKKTIKDAMIALNDSYDSGTWVECSACGKWRYLKEVQEAVSVSGQNSWFCGMNEDIAKNSCDAPEDSFPDEGYAEIQFAPGSLVRARLDGFPWWPAIVEYDPDEENYVWFNSVDDDAPSYYHVTFLGDPVTRSWVRCSGVMPYDVSEIENPKKLSAKIQRWFKDAESQANKALSWSLKERIQTFSFARRYKGKWSRRGRKIISRSRPGRKIISQTSYDEKSSNDTRSCEVICEMPKVSSSERNFLEAIDDLDSLSSCVSDELILSDDQDVPVHMESKKTGLKEGWKNLKGSRYEEPNTTTSSLYHEDTDGFSGRSYSCNEPKAAKKSKTKAKKEGSFAPPLKVQGDGEISTEKSKKNQNVSQRNRIMKIDTSETDTVITKAVLNSGNFEQKEVGNKKHFTSKKGMLQFGTPSKNSCSIKGKSGGNETKKVSTSARKTAKKLQDHDEIVNLENSVKTKKKGLDKTAIKESKIKEKEIPISSYDESIESVVQKWSFTSEVTDSKLDSMEKYSSLVVRENLLQNRDENIPSVEDQSDLECNSVAFQEDACKNYDDDEFLPEVSSNKRVESSSENADDIDKEGHLNKLSTTDDRQESLKFGTSSPITNEICETEITQNGAETEKNNSSKKNCFFEFLEKKKSKLVGTLMSQEDVQKASPQILNESTCAGESQESSIRRDASDENVLNAKANEHNIMLDSEAVSEDISFDIRLKHFASDENESITEKPENSKRLKRSKTKTIPKQYLAKKSHLKQKEDTTGDSKDDRQKGKKKFYVPVRRD